MKKILYLHIGKHKTGTTALQDFMAMNRNELKKLGVLYPGIDENHYPVAKELQENDKPYLQNDNPT